MKQIRLLFLFGCFLATVSCVAAQEDDTSVTVWDDDTRMATGEGDFQEWDAWLEDLRKSFINAGISEQTFDRALGNATPDERVLRLDSKQPEFVRPIWEYLETAVSPQRISKGREMVVRYGDLLERISNEHGVATEVLVSIWGIETNYGGNKGSLHVPRSLATLAYGSDRHAFGRTQLLSAMRLLEEGVMSSEAMVGSWAGALGHMQFLPSNYETYGIDYDGNGVRDLSGSVADALASAAGFLRTKGWHRGENWGMEVVVPDGFDYGLAQPSVRKTGEDWERLGVIGVGGNLPASEGYLLLLAGHRGPVFFVGENFEVLKRYNPSTAYALAVSRLSDCLNDCTELLKSWPVEDETLSRGEKISLQRGLVAEGYAIGVDGIVGPETRAALRSWQRANGEIADGYPTRLLLRRLSGK